MKLKTIASVVYSKPFQPLFVFRPNVMEFAIHYFRTRFHGRILYAVKTNPETQVINLLHHQGINVFDVASYIHASHAVELFDEHLWREPFRLKLV